MEDHQKTYSGSCLCGAVSYEITGPLRPVVGCHCKQCRKTSGHHVAATQGYWAQLKLLRDEGLKWYRSSEVASRAFCKDCGSSLFWRRQDDELVSVMTGTLDGPTGLSMECHIRVEDKGDYYEIRDDLPQMAQTDLKHLPSKA